MIRPGVHVGASSQAENDAAVALLREPDETDWREQSQQLKHGLWLAAVRQLVEPRSALEPRGITAFMLDLTEMDAKKRNISETKSSKEL